MGDYEGSPLSLLADLNEYKFVGGTFAENVADLYTVFHLLGWDDGKTTIDDLINEPIDLVYTGDKAAEWASTKAAELVTALDDSTRSMLAEEITASVKGEESWQELKERIKKNYAFSDRRAETIARTESGNAYNIGACECWEESGIVSGVKVVDGDGCDECNGVNGQIWALADAKARPLQHPNCVREFFPILSFGDK